jgi:hypothetical protein
LLSLHRINITQPLGCALGGSNCKRPVRARFVCAITSRVRADELFGACEGMAHIDALWH